MTRVSPNGGDEIDAQNDRPGSSNRRQPPKRPKLTPIALAPPPPQPPPIVLPSDDDDEDEDSEDEDSEDEESNDEYEESVQQVIDGTGNDRSLILSLTDPDLLNCPLCFESLQPPIFQCVKGHTLCSTCRFKISNVSICAQCQCTVVFERCSVLEKILDASRVACKNTIYGCKTMMKYHEKGEHDRVCPYSPCSCPIYTCAFTGTASSLYKHFRSNHAATNFHIAYTFVASLAKHQSFLFLSEETSGTVFVLYQFTVRQGKAVCIVQIAPKTSSGEYRYELKLKDGETSLTFQSPVECVPKLDDYWPTKHFLVVEDYFCPVARVMLEIRISVAT